MGDKFTSKIKKNNLYLGFNLVEDVDDLHSNTSLRDHFAGLAMQSIVVARLDDYEDIAAESYKLADAMLNARGE